MQAAELVAHQLVDEAIIDRRRFPAHAADEADGSHVSSLSTFAEERVTPGLIPPMRSVWAGDIEDRCSETSRTHWLPCSTWFVELLVLLLGLWNCGHRPCDVHTSTGRRCSSPQVDGSNLDSTEMNAAEPVLDGGTQGDLLAAKRLAEAKAVAFEADVTFLVGFADLIVWPVFERRQSLREGTLALPVTLARRGQIERLMGAFLVVDASPTVEGLLALGEIGELAPLQDLGLEGAMETLVLALRLGMIGPAVRHPHPQSHQPHREGGEWPARATAPRTTMGHQHCLRPSLPPKPRHQAPPCAPFRRVS